MRILDRLLVALMNGRIKLDRGEEEFAKYLVSVIGDGFVAEEHTGLLDAVVILHFGNPEYRRRIPGYLARKYYFEELEPLYLEQMKAYHETHEIARLQKEYGWRYDFEERRSFRMKIRMEEAKESVKRGYGLVDTNIKRGSFCLILPRAF